MSRFSPTRAGIINLWDYRDEEFVFSDGWLVLRGPNGSGKTKALEVLFPFVLDGRIEPRRLNPFASEDRTMKANLLYRGQESGLAYVWLEFSDGERFVTVGVGLRAQRHNDKVTRWYFVTNGRVGADFALLDHEDRPIVRKHLAAQLGADVVRDSAEEHRAAIDARLFGLGRERYEQLLNLVLTLRKPQLAKNLDPVSLSGTLADGLRPIEEDLLTEAARSFDDMESVQLTLDGLVAADDATRAFLAIYTTYLRTYARATADKVSARRDETSECRTAVALAEADHESAGEAAERAAAVLTGAELEPPRLRAHLERLKLSDVYKSLGQIEDLERVVGQLASAVKRATDALAKQRDLTGRRTRELVTARQALADRQAEVSRLIRVLAQEAEAAGIAWAPEDADAGDLTARVTARVAARREDVALVRDAAARLTQARKDRDRTGAALSDAKAAAEQAAIDEQLAAQAVRQARAHADTLLTGWVDQYPEMLLLIGLSDLPQCLAAALASGGELDAITPQAVFAQAADPALQQLRDTLARQRSELSTLDAEIAQAESQRAAIAAERDEAPAPWPARPASREGRAGAPLWQLVRFADGLADETAAGVEAALAAANLLDAWISPADESTAGFQEDGFLRPLPKADRPAGPTLADVLHVEEQDYVVAQRVHDILASISLGPITGLTGATPRIDAEGRFIQGVQIGAFTKPAPEFIGATARAHRRTLRLAEYDRRLAELALAHTELTEKAAGSKSTMESIALAASDLPSISPIAAALREQQQKAVLLHSKLDNAEVAAAQHDSAMAESVTAELSLRRLGAERTLPAEKADEVAAAVHRFERCGDQIVAARRAGATALEQADAASGRLDEASDVQAEAEQALDAQQRKYAVEAEQISTLKAAIDNPEAKAILADIENTTADIDRAENALVAARHADVQAQKAVAASVRDVDNSRHALHTALREEQTEAKSLEPYAHPDLLELLRCPAHLRWPADINAWKEALPAEVVALHEAINSATRDLTPTETSLKQTSTRLHRALDDLQNQLSGAGQDYRPEHDYDAGVLVIRVADEDGYAPIKVFADRITGHRRDQELLLTEAERRVLEDTLLASLARQIHQRTIDARDLVDAMDHEMRKRRMSSGVTVGVGWQLADHLDEDQRTVCKMLEKDPARLSPRDLVTMRGHFAARIKTARATRGDRSYRELLAEVLDYRRWRVFAFRLHRPGSAPETLTKARHSQLSGGEQSVSLHLPLFAAAHALFTSASASCPRLLALDEAFAGVDENGRSELMALAVQFDLDLFMTGYDLWATQAAVPGCAHYDLSHSPGEHLVSGVLMVWDGTETLADFDGTLASALGSPGTRALGANAMLDQPSEEDDFLV